MGFSDKQVAVIGACGRQGRKVIELLLDEDKPPAAIIAIDRSAETEVAQHLSSNDIRLVILDIAANHQELEKALGSVDLVINVAGPFYTLGPLVLKAAIRQNCYYIDICDDADAAIKLLSYDEEAISADISALIGAGSAPGVTNLLARLALDSCNGELAEKEVEIAWVTPPMEISQAIFEHMYHSIESLSDGGTEFPSWSNLAPKTIEFLQPIGGIETILFGHPEPATFKHTLGVDLTLRGGTIPSKMMHLAWSLCSVIASAKAKQNEKIQLMAWAYEQFSEGVAIIQKEVGQSSWGGLQIEAWGPDDGLRIQTASQESMQDTTISPCISFAKLLLAGKVPRSGVLSPEQLKPIDFFQVPAKKSDDKLRVCRLNKDGSEQEISLRSLLSE